MFEWNMWADKTSSFACACQYLEIREIRDFQIGVSTCSKEFLAILLNQTSSLYTHGSSRMVVSLVDITEVPGILSFREITCNPFYPATCWKNLCRS
jgi:hypothetical protein